MTTGEMLVELWKLIQKDHPHAYSQIRCLEKANDLGYIFQVQTDNFKDEASNLAVIWHMHESQMLIGKVSVVPPVGDDAWACFTRLEDAVAFKLLKTAEHLEAKLARAVDRLNEEMVDSEAK